MKIVVIAFLNNRSYLQDLKTNNFIKRPIAKILKEVKFLAVQLQKVQNLTSNKFIKIKNLININLLNL